jgi:hypothetical protein
MRKVNVSRDTFLLANGSSFAYNQTFKYSPMFLSNVSRDTLYFIDCSKSGKTLIIQHLPLL